MTSGAKFAVLVLPKSVSIEFKSSDEPALFIIAASELSVVVSAGLVVRSWVSLVSSILLPQKYSPPRIIKAMMIIVPMIEPIDDLFC